MKKYLVVALLFAFKSLVAQPTYDEIRLYQIIMEYRSEHGLPEIPFSISLTKVAQIHAKDVYDYFHEIPNGCNPHSWSAHGAWTKCDYYGDHRNAEGMWNKPRELTSYKGDGYEIAHYYKPPSSRNCTPEGSLRGWKNSPGHNAVILNLNQWKSISWNAIGVGMYKGVSCVWFGKEHDPEGFYVIQNTP